MISESPVRSAVSLRITKTFVLVALSFVPAGLALYFFVSDLIALILAASLGIWMLGTFLLGLSLALSTKRQEGIRLVPPDDAHPLLPQVPATVVLITPPFGLIPGFTLEIEPRFQRGKVLLPRCIIRGVSNEPRRIPLSVTFPHRGEWTTTSADFLLRDPLGFFLFRWEKALISQTTVVPPPAEGRMFPVVSSTHRPGDDLSDVQNREGELYDLKPYDPADGARKILWKVFARRRELVARHPEAAMSPEGRVVVYVMAHRVDDLLVAEALQYLERLQEFGLDIFVSCAGNIGGAIARSVEQARTLMVESVWESDLTHIHARQLEIEALMNAASRGSADSSLARVVLFASRPTVDSKDGFSLAAALHRTVQERKATPTFFITSSGASSRVEHRRRPLVSEFLFGPDDSSLEGKNAPPPMNFLATRVAEQWDIVSL